jgi:hypothetical protein
MPLGDSITAGYVDNYTWKTPFTFGYRGPLYTLLTNAGYDFQFVGKSPEPFNGLLGVPKTVVVPDLRKLKQDGHRGYGGTVFKHLCDGVAGSNGGIDAWMKTDRPDIVLLMMGINSIVAFGDKGNPVEVEKQLQALVQKIFDAKPDVQLIVAEIIPYQTGRNVDSVAQYNSFIRNTLVPHFANQGRCIRSVDHYNNFLTQKGKVNAALYSNIAHPTAAGYKRMAKTWFQAIRAMAPPRRPECSPTQREQANSALPCEMNSKIDPRNGLRTHFGWQKHGVVRTNGSAPARTLPAEFYFIGGQWRYNNSQMPYLVYMPECKRLLLAASVDKPDTKAIQVFSDDCGKTWTRPAWMHTDAAGNPDLGAATQLTYLGNGKLIVGTESRYWFSANYGQSWISHAPVPPGADGKTVYQWDPMLADRDPASGKVVRLVETRYKENGTFGTAEYFSQACVRVSTDEGKTWTKEVDVPQWKRISEVVLCRANNGDLVAACRIDNPKRFLVGYEDQHSGLATSISKDNGRTWSALNRLYDWGRHHPHMVVLPNGHIILTYVVRNGYLPDKSGRCQFGIEAVVSTDNGATWDLDHKYLLASNSSIMKAERQCWGSPQSTSNAVLDDGSLLTAFCTGVRNVPTQTIWLMDVALVRWRPGGEPVNSEDALRKASYDSDLRNKFDLDSVKLKE